MEALPGQLLKATFSQELPVRIDDVVNPYQVPLQLHQFDKVFLQTKMGQLSISLCFRLHFGFSYRAVDVVCDVRDNVLQLDPRLVAIVVIHVAGLVVLEQALHDELIVEESLKGPEEERVQGEVAHFAGLEIPVNLLKRLVPLEGLFQLFENQSVLFYIPVIELEWRNKPMFLATIIWR